MTSATLDRDARLYRESFSRCRRDVSSPQRDEHLRNLIKRVENGRIHLAEHQLLLAWDAFMRGAPQADVEAPGHTYVTIVRAWYDAWRVALDVQDSRAASLSDRQRTLAILAELGTGKERVLAEGREQRAAGEAGEAGEAMPPFPRAVSDTELFVAYRYASLPDMKRWVLWALQQLLRIPDEPLETRAYVEQLAVKILDRPLFEPEARVLGEVLGNMLTVIGIYRNIHRAQRAR